MAPRMYRIPFLTLGRSQAQADRHGGRARHGVVLAPCLEGSNSYLLVPSSVAQLMKRETDWLGTFDIHKCTWIDAVLPDKRAIALFIALVFP